MKKRLRIVLIVAAILMLLGLSALLIINLIVTSSVSANIGEITEQDGYEVAVVLGAKVHEGGRLSDMLRDRMNVAISLYQKGAVKTLLLSGDNRGEWGETKWMKAYAIENGVREEDILEDEEGFSTYESMYRAKTLFGKEKFVVVTQKYHLYRALYIAESMDIDAMGASADLERYAGQLYREIREILARAKDFALCLFD